MLWAARECGGADFGDARITQRLVKLVVALSDRPESSVPEACVCWKDTKAAYRFFDNERVTPEAILAAHREATLERIRGSNIVLIVQDTTVHNHATHHKTKGLGPIGPDYAQGFFQHTAMAVAEDGIPLGILGQKVWARTGPRPDKESRRWIDLMKEAAQGISETTRAVMVADREADMYDLFAEAQEHGHDLLIRSTHDRPLESHDGNLLETVAKAPLLATVPLHLPRADQRPEQEVTMTLQAQKVILKPPKKAGTTSPIGLTVVLAQEASFPEGREPVSWCLLTTLSVETAEDALRCLRFYTYRWRIERYHYILKSGCKVEELQLETVERLRRALAVYSVVAWRLLWLTYHARENPDGPCTVALSDSEWKALWATSKKTLNLPEKPPTLRGALRMVAGLAGFLGRKGDGDPGVNKLWLGLRLLQERVVTWELFHPPQDVGNE